MKGIVTGIPLPSQLASYRLTVSECISTLYLNLISDLCEQSIKFNSSLGQYV